MSFACTVQGFGTVVPWEVSVEATASGGTLTVDAANFTNGPVPLLKSTLTMKGETTVGGKAVAVQAASTYPNAIAASQSFDVPPMTGPLNGATGEVKVTAACSTTQVDIAASRSRSRPSARSPPLPRPPHLRPPRHRLRRQPRACRRPGPGRGRHRRAAEDRPGGHRDARPRWLRHLPGRRVVYVRSRRAMKCTPATPRAKRLQHRFSRRTSGVWHGPP